MDWFRDLGWVLFCCGGWCVAVWQYYLTSKAIRNTELALRDIQKLVDDLEE